MKHVLDEIIYSFARPEYYKEAADFVSDACDLLVNTFLDNNVDSIREVKPKDKDDLFYYFFDYFFCKFIIKIMTKINYITFF
mgnify:CR=1 FL=1